MYDRTRSEMTADRLAAHDATLCEILGLGGDLRLPTRRSLGALGHFFLTLPEPSRASRNPSPKVEKARTVSTIMIAGAVIMPGEV